MKKLALLGGLLVVLMSAVPAAQATTATPSMTSNDAAMPSVAKKKPAKRPTAPKRTKGGKQSSGKPAK